MFILKYVDRITSTLTFALLFMLVGFQMYDAGLRIYSPFNHLHAHLVSESLNYGDPIKVDFAFDKNRLCRVDLDLFVTDVTPGDMKGEIISRSRVPGSPQSVGHIALRTSFPQPETTQSGHDYDYQITIISQCAEGIHVDPYQTMRFHVN